MKTRKWGNETHTQKRVKDLMKGDVVVGDSIPTNRRTVTQSARPCAYRGYYRAETDCPVQGPVNMWGEDCVWVLSK